MVSVRTLTILLCALACLMIPAASFADSSVDFSNSGGTLAGSSSGLTLSGSTLIAVVGGGVVVVGATQPPSAGHEAPHLVDAAFEGAGDWKKM